MGDEAGTVDMPDELTAFDALMHRGEANPRTRSGIMAIQILAATPDWDRFFRLFDNASRRVPRMRQKVVVPTLPTTAARWVVDPDFNLDFHVRRARVPEPGELRDVLDIAELMVQSPLDISRPLWSATLLEGMSGGRSAVLMHMSHAMSDGMGSVALFEQIFDFEPDAPAKSTAPLPVPHDLTAGDLMREGLNGLPVALIRGLGRAVSGGARVLSHAIAAPLSVVEYVQSGARLMTPPAPPSPLLRRRGIASRSEALDMPLTYLHRAAKSAEGSLNDAYLAALCGALRRYHDELGIPVITLPMAIPVSLRTEGDPAGGNRFTGVDAGGADRRGRSGQAHQGDSRTDDRAARRRRPRSGVDDRADSQLPARGVDGSDGGIIHPRRCPGQQCARLSRRYLPGRSESAPAVRTRPASRYRDDGFHGVAVRYLHRQRAL